MKAKTRITKKMYREFVDACTHFHWNNGVCSSGSMICKCDFAIVLREINKRLAERARHKPGRTR